jgi:transposase
MSNTIICGMDAHDNTLSHRIGVNRETPETVNRETPETKTVKNTQDGRQKLFQYLRSLAQKNEEARIIVAYEASPLGFGIYDDCEEAGIECHILAPTKMPKAVNDKKRKYDERDAQKIFELVRAHV